MSENVHKSAINLANEVGQFIEYWGFKKIHGKVWCLVFLSKKPVDANFLIENLKVSKALISMTIKDLIYYKVLEEAPKTGPTLCYTANMQIKDVIFEVLTQRESQLLLKIKAACEILNRSNSSGEESNIDNERLEKMNDMVNTADALLKSLISLNEVNLLPAFNALNFKD